jgi:penicillin-insensitive murein endopeptidase
MHYRFVLSVLGVLLAGGAAATAELPAKQLFGREATPAPMASSAIGSYAKGCLAGGRMLPINGPAWQVMRLSRNRNWGHPELINYLERLAKDAHDKDGWPGLLVGDMAQPRGGPMVSGHASHQIGLDVDVWYDGMPDHTLTREEREKKSASSLIKDPYSVDPNKFTPAHVALLKRAASYPEVERIFVNPAIKKALCEAAGSDRGWLEKIRPWWGHDDHFHVRLACPKGSKDCVAQPDPPDGDGCGKPLEDWFAMFRHPKKPSKPAKPKPPLTLADLPAECQTVLDAGAVADSAPSTQPASANASAIELPWTKPAAAATLGRGVPLPLRKPSAVKRAGTH